MSTIQINSSNFKQEVIDSQTPVLVDFYADWCGPCRMIAPALEGIAQKYTGKVKVCKLNVDNAQDIASAYRVSSIPMVLLFKNGQQVDGFLGAQPEAAIEEFVQKHV